MSIGQPTIWENGTDIVPLDQTCCLLQPFIHQSLEVPSIVFIYFSLLLLLFCFLLEVLLGWLVVVVVVMVLVVMVMVLFYFGFCFGLFICFETGSYVTQAGLEFIVHLRLSLNTWSPCLYLLNMFLSKEFTYLTKVKWQKSGHFILVIIT